MTLAVDETKHVDELRLLEAEAVHIIREVVAELSDRSCWPSAKSGTPKAFTHARAAANSKG